MSTSEYRSVDAESDLPIGASELAALATQLFAASIRPGPDSPPQTTPVAPRGTVPDATAATSAGAAAVGAANPLTPTQFAPVADVYVPGPDFACAGRHSADGAGRAARHGPGCDGRRRRRATPPEVHSIRTRCRPRASCRRCPGCWPAPRPRLPSAPRGSAPGWPSGAPSVADLGWTDAPAAAPAGDEANYYFLSRPPTASPAEPVPQLPDDHEVFDVNAVRADFPILRETVNGKPLIWFDNAATTQKPQAVIDRLSYFYAHENSNIHRAAHELAARATDAYEDARDTVRRFIGASKSEEIIFVRGTTEAINLVAYAWGGKHLGPATRSSSPTWSTTPTSFPGNCFRSETGAMLQVAPVDDCGQSAAREFEDLLGPKTKLVAATHVSNALGTVTPAKKIVELAHRYGARVLIDGAQSIPHIPIDVQDLGADFFVFSGHKIFGPTGIGVCTGSEDVLDGDAAVAGRRQHDRRRDASSVRSTRARRTSSKPAPATSPTPSVSARRCDYVERVGVETHRRLRARAARVRHATAGRRSPACG